VNTVAQVTPGTQIVQPATDAQNTLYIGTGDTAGWKVQRITAGGPATTIAGNYRYFYGDGRYPLNAAFGPRLAVSVHAGNLLITDISNSRIRYVDNQPIVMTLAGTGVSAYTGDGGLAYNATLSTPTATVTDMLGRVFIADTDNNVVRSILGSTIATYAGTGIQGGSGDGGPASAARLNRPFGITVDSANNLLFTDLSNCVVRSITPTGTIQLVAGSYTNGYGGDGGVATSAQLSFPRGIAVDPSNNIYVCDTGNARVRRIDAITQIITTVAGNGVSAFGGDGGLATLAHLSSPTGVAADSAGNIYIADTNNHCIRFVNMTTHTITTVAGVPRQAGYRGDYSFATSALLNGPSHIVYDSGYYYIADDNNCRIRYVNPTTNIINSIAGNGSPLSAGDGGPALDAVFGRITSLASDGTDIYISDGVANTIRKIVTATSTIVAVAGTGIGGYSGDGGSALSAQISSPQTVVVGSNAIYFTDTNNQRVRKVDTQTGILSTVAGTGIAGYNGDSLSSTEAMLNYPAALGRDSLGNLYVGDASNYRIRHIDLSGFITTYAGNGLAGTISTSDTLTGTSLGPTNTFALGASLYLADPTTSAIWSLDPAVGVRALSAVSTPAYLGDGSPLSNAYLNRPTGITVDSSANWILCDEGNSRIRATYSFGRPLNPIYVNMNFTYNNYFTSTGSAYITLNGNRIATFNGSNQQDLAYSLIDANIYDYPLQNSNPLYGNQVPYIEITQISTFGYSKLSGSLSVNHVPGQENLQNSVDSNSGILMNSGSLIFPYSNNGITIDNKHNDASLRSIYYTGSLISASDRALKEHIEYANLDTCSRTLASIPLRRYKYTDPYISTFHVRDTYRLGFLTTDISPIFPNSISPIPLGHAWAPSSIHTLDTAQIQYAHFGVTQQLISILSTLEAEIDQVQKDMRITQAQRNNVL